MLLRDEDVRYRALRGHVLERVLNGRTVIDLVELDDIRFCAQLGEEALGGLAVRAVGLGEDSWIKR